MILQLLAAPLTFPMVLMTGGCSKLTYVIIILLIILHSYFIATITTTATITTITTTHHTRYNTTATTTPLFPPPLFTRPRHPCIYGYADTPAPYAHNTGLCCP